MSWTPNLVQRAARLDPDTDPQAEAEIRVTAAIRMLGAFEATREPDLLTAAADLIVAARWFIVGDEA